MKNPLRVVMHVPVPWVFVLTYAFGVAIEYGWVWPPRIIDALAHPGLRIIGGALLAVGATVAGWGLITFRKARTTTVPGRTSSTLVTWGPYRFSRNPMYIGLSLAYLGEAAFLHQVWPVLLLPLTLAYLNWTVIPVEEDKLTQAFGEAYQRYRSGVRRWM